MVYICGLNSIFPKNKVFQDEVKGLGKKLFSSKSNFKRMEKVYNNSGVKVRYLSQPLDWYLQEHNWSERNYLFKKNTISLLKSSIKQTFEKANVKPEQIGGIIFVNSTGISTLSLIHI